MVEIARRLGRSVEVMRWPEDRPIDVNRVEAALIDNASIAYVALVHCETTSGVFKSIS